MLVELLGFDYFFYCEGIKRLLFAALCKHLIHGVVVFVCAVVVCLIIFIAEFEKVIQFWGTAASLAEAWLEMLALREATYLAYVGT